MMSETQEREFVCCINNKNYTLRDTLGPDAVRAGGGADTGELRVAPDILKTTAAEAFRDLSFYFRSSHLDALAAIVRDPASSENERYIGGLLIRNAIIAAEGVLPICQDTGTATVMAWKGERVKTGCDDRALISEGIEETYRGHNLRYSQLAPLSMFEEVNTGSNMPAQIDIYSSPGAQYHFLFVAKGAGSSNKTAFFQKTRAFLAPGEMESFLRLQIGKLGADACPPYHIAVVIGGTSPEENLRMQKMASSGWLDALPGSGDQQGRPFRDAFWEEKVMQIAAETGIGAQFGGRHMALAARVVRLVRHGGSCPVSVGVSCSAHRNMVGMISEEGVFLEKLDRNPARLLGVVEESPAGEPVRIDFGESVDNLLSRLRGLAPGTMLLLSGVLAVGRDLAHARIAASLRDGGEMPDYMRKYPVCYAGPAKKPENGIIGSFGPTTAQRMDGYMERFMKEGACLVSLGKGSRSESFRSTCRRYGGVYLGTVGGAAALLADRHITSCEVIDFPELGMEAVHRIGVRDLPAFVLCNDRGKSFYAPPSGRIKP